MSSSHLLLSTKMYISGSYATLLLNNRGVSLCFHCFAESRGFGMTFAK